MNSSLTIGAAATLCCLVADACRAQEMPMGQLGHPLGTYLTIEGEYSQKWNRRNNAHPAVLIDTVNGKKLDRPVQITIDNVNGSPDSGHYVLRGHEQGRTVGIPKEVSEKEGIAPWSTNWHLYRYFTLTSVVSPAGNLMKDPPDEQIFVPADPQLQK